MITAHPAVRDVMTTRLVTAREDTPFKELVRLLTDNRVGALPVVDGRGSLVGIVSESDLLLKEQYAGGELPVAAWILEADRVEGRQARDVMTWPVVTVAAADSIAKAAHAMLEFGVRHLPVVGRRARLEGIVSRSDLLGVYLRPDAQIRDQVLYGVADEMLSLDPAGLDVQVRDGVVKLSGLVGDLATAELLCSVAGRMPGVVGVVDRLKIGSAGTAEARP